GLPQWLDGSSDRVAPHAELRDESRFGGDSLADRPSPGHDGLTEALSGLIDEACSTHWRECARLIEIHPMILSFASTEFRVSIAYPPTASPYRRQALWAGAAIAVTAVNLRTAVTGFTPLLEVIGDDLGYGLALAGVLGTVPAASFAAFGFLAPYVTRRFGLERTAAIALSLTAVSLLFRALSSGPLSLVMSTVLALAGIGATNVVIVPLVKAWFPQRIAL